MSLSDREFFNEIAPQWDSQIEVDPEKINHILDVSNLHEGDTVLDVGTGTGVLVPFIVSRIGGGGKIDAIDFSEGMLNEARRKYSDLGNVNFFLADVENDQFTEQYDHIMMYCMYPHLHDGEETVEWLAKVNLKPGGTLVIAFPQSKEQINGIHHHNDGHVHSNHLVDGNIQKARFGVRDLNVDYIEDTPEFYIIRITKD